MKVFIVERGEMNEGGNVESVHRSEQTAIAAALAKKPCFAGGWIPAKGQKNFWINGCDYVAVVEANVEK